MDWQSGNRDADTEAVACAMMELTTLCGGLIPELALIARDIADAESTGGRHEIGRDRFRYDDKDGSGSFICSHFANGGGDGFHLVEHFLDCGFPAAMHAVAGILGMGEGDPPRP